MKKQMKRTVYEAPVTELFRVELEGNFCGSAEVENDPEKPLVGIEEHEINKNFNVVEFDSTWEDVQ